MSHQEQQNSSFQNKSVLVSDLLYERAKELQDYRQRKLRGEKIRLAVPTGFAAFDGTYSGLPRSRVTVLGADTGIGKTSIARAIAYGAASEGHVLIFNLEDGNKNFADKLLGEQTGIGSLDLERLEFDPGVGKRLDIAASLQVYSRWHVDEESYDPRDQIRVALEIHRATPLSLIVVDYVQLIRLKNVQGKQENISEALAYYQWLAKKCDCAVLVLSQVATKQISHRGWEYYFKARESGAKGDELYEGYVPQRGDFFWASELDQLGKMVMVGFRPGPYRREHGDGSDQDKFMYLYMLKVNNGPSGKKFALPWNPKLSQVGVG